jgi:hypothetical protein
LCNHAKGTLSEEAVERWRTLDPQREAGGDALFSKASGSAGDAVDRITPMGVASSSAIAAMAVKKGCEAWAA